MSDKTKISYLSASWNPIAMRCTRVSAGCANCWHLRMADRMMNNPALHDAVRAAMAGGHPVLDEARLTQPLHWRKPRTIGTQFMGDLFHASVTDEQRDRVYAVMALCPQHTFMVLTKRPERMAEYFRNRQLRIYRVSFWAKHFNPRIHETGRCSGPDTGRPWPLPNVWHGTSCENQQAADERIPHLLATPAAVRFLSVEPLLGEVRLHEWMLAEHGRRLIGADAGISWVIVGCESGPKRRPCKIEWVRSLVEQCKAAGVPCYVKQLDINGRVSHDMSEWPEDLGVRQMPEVKP